jgi:clan AA aspartic protease
MGATHVTGTVRNPANPEQYWEGLFLVDTGAVDCLVPRKHLESIGMMPEGQRTYVLADGNEIKMDITTGRIEFMGDIVGVTIVFGADDAKPILGVTAMESVGMRWIPAAKD